VLPIPKIYSNNLQILVNKLLAKDANSRPGIEEIFLIDFIKEKREIMKYDKEKEELNNNSNNNNKDINNNNNNEEKRKVKKMCFKFSDFANNNNNNNSDNNNSKYEENLNLDYNDNNKSPSRNINIEKENDFNNNNNNNNNEGIYRDLSSKRQVNNFNNFEYKNLEKFLNNDKEERSKSQLISKGNIKENKNLFHCRKKIDLDLINKTHNKSFNNENENYKKSPNGKENQNGEIVKFNLMKSPISSVNKDKSNKKFNFLPNGKSPNAKNTNLRNIKVIKNIENNNNNNDIGIEKEKENVIITLRKNSSNSINKNKSISREKENLNIPSEISLNLNTSINISNISDNRSPSNSRIKDINSLSLQESKYK